MSLRRVRVSAASVAAVVAVAVGCSDGGGEAGPDASVQGEVQERSGLQVTALSTRADMVTGGDVLIEVTGIEGTLEVDAGGTDVGASFSEPDAHGTATGLVAGLPVGKTVIRATSGDHEAELAVVNHPVAGPVFSGPHLEPMACTTEANGLAAPTDDDCSAPTVTRWTYVSTDGTLKPLDDPSVRPADVATAEVPAATGAGTDTGGTDTGDDGAPDPATTSVDLIVRTESGTIDRGVYWIHVLDPAPSSPEWDPSAWNGDLVYRFGGGCGTSFSQGRPLGDGGGPAGPMLDLDLLRAGYAQATNTLNTFQVQCNDVLAAEALMMTKERFAEGFGLPDQTVGEGPSGGAIQLFLIAQGYPGLLDAIVPSLPFPDALSMAPGVTDCGLLNRYYSTPTGSALSPEQRAAVNGHLTAATCSSWVGSFLGTIDPTSGCSLDPVLVYDPVTNPEGARCTLSDSIVNLLGTDPDTGFAIRPVDNIGVQYGLGALLDGAISVDQFLDLNASAGGYDLDGTIVDQRMEVPAEQIELVYRTGRINQGGGDLSQIPILALNVYTDPIGDIHDRFRPFAIMERLRLPDGERAPNYVLWTRPGGVNILDSFSGAAGRADRLAMVDLAADWAANLADLGVPAGDRTAQDLAATRPDGAVDDCTLPDGQRVVGFDIYDEGRPCALAYPLRGDPRTVAGGPLDSLVAKCALTEVDAGAYGVELSAEQVDRLRRVFPDGVCDWEAPGVGVTEPAGTWLDYTDGPP